MLATLNTTTSRVSWTLRALVALSALAVLALPAIYLSTTSGVLADDAKRPAEKEPAAEFLPPLSPSEEKILDTLEEDVTSMDFTETPLQEAADFLSDVHEIQVKLDTKALEDVGMGSDTPMTGRVNAVKLKSGLRLLLRPKDLTYLVQHEVLLITTQDAAEQELITRTYPVGDLLGGVDPDFDSLIEVITSTVSPSSWEEIGGQGSIQEMLVAKSLVIAQTRVVHDEVLTLLRALRAARKTSGGSFASDK